MREYKKRLILRERLEKVRFLGRGSHYSFKKDGDNPAMCVMEAVAWVTKGVWTDRPGCVDGMLNTLAISVNDFSTDEIRQALIPLIPRLVNTRNDGHETDRIVMRNSLKQPSFESPEIITWFAQIVEAGREPEVPALTVKELLGEEILLPVLQRSF